MNVQEFTQVSQQTFNSGGFKHMTFHSHNSPSMLRQNPSLQELVCRIFDTFKNKNVSNIICILHKQANKQGMQILQLFCNSSRDAAR